MQEELFTLQQGLHTEARPELQPKGTYRDMRNFYREESGQAVSERGHLLVIDLPESGTQPMTTIGHYVLKDEIILFRKAISSAVSEIGVLSSADVYTAIVSNRGGANATLQFATDILAFNKPIDVEARVHFDGDRLVYFVDGVNPDRVINLDDLPLEAALDTSTRLQFDTILPRVTKLNSKTGGSLKTGIYMFVGRYLTSGGNPSSAGVISQPIPVVNEDTQVADRGAIDGAPPQTIANGAIEITFDNVDLAFPFLEIIAITLVGVVNAPTFNIISRSEISSTSFTFTYTDESQSLGTVILSAITSQSAKTDTSKNIKQKDGLLIRSNVIAETIDVPGFQTIANDILVDWVTKPIEIVENIDIQVDNIADGTFAPWAGENRNNPITTPGNLNVEYNDLVSIVKDFGLSPSLGGANTIDYKGENQTFDLKSFPRGEVMSLCIMPVLKGGTIGFAYHIPGRHLVVTPAQSDSNGTVFQGFCGTYISTEKYPSGRGYPAESGDGNTFVRHLRMPTVAECQFQRSRATINANKIVPMGLRLTNIIIPTTTKDLIQGYIIGMQPRNSNLNRTIVAQGFKKHFFNMSEAGDVFKMIIPSFGKCSIKDSYFTSTPSVGEDDMNKKLIAFYAPDIIHGLVKDYSFTGIKEHMTAQGTRRWDARGADNFGGSAERAIDNFIDCADIFKVGDTKHVLESPKLDISPSGDVNDWSQSGTVDNTKTFVSPFANMTDPIKLKGTNGFVLLNALSALESFVAETTLMEERYDDNAGDDVYDSVVSFDNVALTTYRTTGAKFLNEEVVSIELVTLLNDITNAYGAIVQASYIPLLFKLTEETQTTKVGLDAGPTEAEVFNGDVFISKYALMVSDMGAGNPNNRGVRGRSLVYFWLESLGNYNYRHFESVTNADNTSPSTSLPYYPKYKTLGNGANLPIGLHNYVSVHGHAIGYNKHYSKLNDVRTFVPKPLLFTEVTKFPNRSVYSETSLEGEISDSMRIFLANNFQDIPKNRGEIVNTFIHNKNFFIHCETGLFQAFVNAREQVITDVSEIVIGTGKAFSQPPSEIFDQEGGYVGTTSKWAGVSTPFGYIFPDNDRGKVFLLQNEIKEISDIGNFTFFKGFIERLADDPPAGIGYVAGYDFGRKRYILTKLGTLGDTIDFSPKLNSWTGYHDYKPNWYIHRGKELLATTAKSIYESNVGVQGAFLGATVKAKASITFSLATPRADKMFDNIFLLGRTVDRNNIFLPARNFSRLRCHNLDKSTGDINLIYNEAINPVLNRNEKKVTFKGNEYRFSVPPNSVVDPALDVLQQTNIDYDLQFRGNMLGGYIIVLLEYDPTKYTDLDVDLMLELLRLEYRVNAI